MTRTRHKILSCLSKRIANAVARVGWGQVTLNEFAVVRWSNTQCFFGIVYWNMQRWPGDHILLLINDDLKRQIKKPFPVKSPWKHRFDKMDTDGHAYLTISIDNSTTGLLDELFEYVDEVVKTPNMSIGSFHPSGMKIIGPDETLESLAVEADLSIQTGDQHDRTSS